MASGEALSEGPAPWRWEKAPAQGILSGCWLHAREWQLGPWEPPSAQARRVGVSRRNLEMTQSSVLKAYSKARSFRGTVKDLKSENVHGP